jgi:hypothetical protein
MMWQDFSSLKETTMSKPNIAITDIDEVKEMVTFHIEERECYGVADPEPRDETFTKEQLQGLPVIHDTKPSYSQAGIYKSYIIFSLFGMEIGWLVTVENEGDFAGNSTSYSGPVLVK